MCDSLIGKKGNENFRLPISHYPKSVASVPPTPGEEWEERRFFCERRYPSQADVTSRFRSDSARRLAIALFGSYFSASS